MSAWMQPDLPFDDPVTVLPRDGRARMIFAWRGKAGRLDRQYAAEIDDVATMRHLMRGQPDVFETQWWMGPPYRRALANAVVGTHAYCDFDYYNVPALADRKPEAIGKALRRHCDDTGIPLPSAITCSGRGINAKWCFDEPVGHEDVGTMVALNRALQRRLADFGADPRATDAARLLRVTGSLHSGANRMVEVLHLEQRDGLTITYDAHAFARQIVPGADDAPVITLLPPIGDLDRKTRQEARRNRQPRPAWFRTREGWHWLIVEDVWRLADMRWNGIVPKGSRDAFGFVIACQIARIVHPDQLWHEIRAAVGRIVPAEFVDRDFARYCGTLMRRAREAFMCRRWSVTYHLPKSYMIDVLQISRAEQHHMHALIDDAEYLRRHAERERTRRAAAGMIERSAYEARAAERRPIVTAMRARGMTWRAIAAELGISVGEAHRLGEA